MFEFAVKKINKNEIMPMQQKVVKNGVIYHNNKDELVVELLLKYNAKTRKEKKWKWKMDAKTVI